MSAKVYSIVGLPRRASVDRAYIGLRASDELVAKVLAISELAQIARSEQRAREYLLLKWDARSKVATRLAVSMAERGKPADKIIGAVDQIMERWAGDVEDAFCSELEGIYRLARIAAYRKAASRSKASLQYATPNFTEETVSKAKKTAKLMPKFDLADEGAVKALRQHQVFWMGEHYKKNVSDGIAKTAREVIVEAGADRSKAGKLLTERLGKALGKADTPNGFHGSSKQYFEGLAANAATVARAHGQMRSFADIGISTYTISNPHDERTCERCSHMDGQVFKLQHGLDQMHAELKAKTPKQVREAHPWLGTKALKGLKGGDDLAKAGQALPPFHFRCRCTPDINEEIGSWDALTPMSAPTAEEESAPLGLVIDGEVATDETRAADKVINTMMSGDLKSRKAIRVGKGVNESEIVEVKAADGSLAKGVWKEASGENEDLRPNIKAGTYWKREELTYQVDRMMGPGGVVPPTITRQIKDADGSFQSFAEGAKKGDDVYPQLRELQKQGGYSSNDSFRRTFLLDVVSGNDDRHSGNIMYSLAADNKTGWSVKAVAIDNGLTFPEGPAVRFFFPGMPYEDEQKKFLKLDDASQKSLGGLKLDKLAGAIHKAGVKRVGARAAMVRVQALKDDPEILDKGHRGAAKWLTEKEYPDGAVKEFIRASALRPEVVIDKKDLDHIDKILDKLYAKE